MELQPESLLGQLSTLTQLFCVNYITVNYSFVIVSTKTKPLLLVCNYIGLNISSVFTFINICIILIKLANNNHNNQINVAIPPC